MMLSIQHKRILFFTVNVAQFPYINLPTAENIMKYK